MFGEFIKSIRARNRIGLREFCLNNGHDPSNWSKLERGVIHPPQKEAVLREWATQLGLGPGTEDWLKFFDLAALDAGRIPDYVAKDEAALAKLPVFFRTVSGRKPSPEDLNVLREIIRQSETP
jgi:transcriptional regulator with XRE-family HTH domain